MRMILYRIFSVVIRVFYGHVHGIGRFYPIRVIFYFLHRHLHPNVIQVENHQIFLDPQDDLCLSINPSWEKLQTELVKREIKKGDTALDIGAHIGYYTLLLARLVGENGKVFAFEPEPANFALLKKNVKVNGFCDNVILNQKAVASETKRTQLFLGRDNTTGHSLYKGHYRSRRYKSEVEVEAVRLDDYFKGERVDFIKMDIEGGEGEALIGMLSLLERNKHIKIITEFCPGMLEASNVGTRKYLELLTRLSFKLFNINEEKGELESTTAEELSTKEADKEFATNLLCIRDELL